jgi:hypothetical protein
MISVGSIVTVRQCGTVAWVVESRNPDGSWRVVGKAVDVGGRPLFTSRNAGVGDLTEVTPPPTYTLGATITYNGAQHVVADVTGDFVTLVVPEKLYPLRHGHALRIPAGNSIIVSKSDLVLGGLS